MTYGEDAHLLIPILTGFFFLGCAWFASKNITGSIMQIIVKYGSFFMGLLSIVLGNANSRLSAQWYSLVHVNATNTNIVNNLNAFDIGLTVWLVFALVMFILVAFVEGLTNWKKLANKHEPDKDQWEMKPL